MLLGHMPAAGNRANNPGEKPDCSRNRIMRWATADCDDGNSDLRVLSLHSIPETTHIVPRKPVQPHIPPVCGGIGTPAGLPSLGGKQEAEPRGGKEGCQATAGQTRQAVTAPTREAQGAIPPSSAFAPWRVPRRLAERQALRPVLPVADSVDTTLVPEAEVLCVSKPAEHPR